MKKDKDGKVIKDYDTTVARIAGNLLSGIMANNGIVGTLGGDKWKIPYSAIDAAVTAARTIVNEVRLTEPKG